MAAELLWDTDYPLFKSIFEVLSQCAEWNVSQFCFTFFPLSYMISF